MVLAYAGVRSNTRADGGASIPRATDSPGVSGQHGTCAGGGDVGSVKAEGDTDTAAHLKVLDPETDAWLTARVDQLISTASLAFEKDSALRSYKKALDELTGGIQQRKLSENPAFIAHYQNLLNFLQVLTIGNEPDHELGFNVPDKQYFDETRQYVQVPEFLLDKKFLHYVSRFETLEKAKDYLRALNAARDPSDQLLFLSYTSRHLGAADNDKSFRRLLIIVPGNTKDSTPDKWVQFSITDPKGQPRIRNVSVVTAVTQPDGTYNAYFKDFFRTYHRDGSITIKGRWELGEGDDNCAKCHKSGVLPIFPEARSLGKGEEGVLEAVNQRFRSYGSPRFGGYLDETKFGPGLGTAPPETRAERWGSKLNPDVAKAMSCSPCHMPKGLGSLNWPMDDVIISSFIEGGQMPLGATLKESDRTDLYHKLVQEYFATDDKNPGILKSWLLGLSQSTSPIP